MFLDCNIPLYEIYENSHPSMMGLDLGDHQKHLHIQIIACDIVQPVSTKNMIYIVFISQKYTCRNVPQNRIKRKNKANIVVTTIKPTVSSHSRISNNGCTNICYFNLLPVADANPCIVICVYCLVLFKSGK